MIRMKTVAVITLAFLFCFQTLLAYQMPIRSKKLGKMNVKLSTLKLGPGEANNIDMLFPRITLAITNKKGSEAFAHYQTLKRMTPNISTLMLLEIITIILKSPIASTCDDFLSTLLSDAEQGLLSTPNKRYRRGIEEIVSLFLVLLNNNEMTFDSSAWNIMNRLVQSTYQSGFRLSSRLRSRIIKTTVVLRRYRELRKLQDSLFYVPLPEAFSLDNALRVLLEIDPVACLHMFASYSAQLLIRRQMTVCETFDSSPKISQRREEELVIPTPNSFGYVIRALMKVVKSNETYYVHKNSSDAMSFSIIDLVRLSADYGQLTSGLAVTALKACRVSGSADWQTAMEIYNLAKLVVRTEDFAGGLIIAKVSTKSDDNLMNQVSSPVLLAGSQALNVPKNTSKSESVALQRLGVLPSIIYGQSAVIMAQGGAEAQTFQVMCEMLEAGYLFLFQQLLV